MIQRKEYCGLENRKILVVDDVELNQYLARHIIESWGCEVKLAENGKESVDMLEAEDFDLILMDIQMPVMDGIEATRNIRKIHDEWKSSTPIVALTANALVHEFDTYQQAGMNDCLPKPIHEPSLYNAIIKNIRQHKPTSMPNTLPSETPAPAPIKAEAKMYDLTLVESISGGDQSFINKMLKLFLDTAPVTLGEMQKAADARDWAALSKLAHKLKSTVDSMGIVLLQQEIRKIESDGKQGQDVDHLPELVEKVEGIMALVMQQVRKDHAV